MPKKPPPETALYVKLPATAGERLDRAAQELGVRKKDLVASLITRYVPGNATTGSYAFQAYDPPEVMTAEQAAELLQVEVKVVVELAEAGRLPGRKVGPAWRFSRTALVAWLGGTEKPR